MTELTPRRVSPFGHPGLTGCVRLPPAFRSLPRPSSPPYTQASPARSRSLDYKIGQAKHAHCETQSSLYESVSLVCARLARLMISIKDYRFPRSTYSFDFQSADRSRI